MCAISILLHYQCFLVFLADEADEDLFFTIADCNVPRFVFLSAEFIQPNMS